MNVCAGLVLPIFKFACGGNLQKFVGPKFEIPLI